MSQYTTILDKKLQDISRKLYCIYQPPVNLWNLTFDKITEEKYIICKKCKVIDDSAKKTSNM
jgi:hypothetical protein